VEPGPVGRDGEIAEICAFLSAASAVPAALAITGDPGIGKTIVWKQVLEVARRSSRVLSCQPAAAERPLAFSALEDLLGDDVEEVLPALGEPRRRAVEATLLREVSSRPPQAISFETGHSLPERQVLARGVLDALRVLSGGAPLVLAVDDAQWLDRSSATVLEFCIRRLRSEPVTVLLTFRKNNATIPLGLERALPPDQLHRVLLGPLSLGAIGEILRSRLGAVLPRYTMTQLYEACGGNPFYALECARALLDHPRLPLTNEPIPLPRNLSDLVRRRVRHLTKEARLVGQLVAASSDPRERQIRAACDDEESWVAIDQAITEGIIEREGDILRFTHPLLRSVLYTDMTLDQRRQVHQRLAAFNRGIGGTRLASGPRCRQA
jgi:AAA ATPase domain